MDREARVCWASQVEALLAAPGGPGLGGSSAYTGAMAPGAASSSSYGAAPTGYTYDPALLAALHAAPSPHNYSGGGDWYMDTGAAAHMASNPGILSRVSRTLCLLASSSVMDPLFPSPTTVHPPSLSHHLPSLSITYLCLHP